MIQFIFVFPTVFFGFALLGVLFAGYLRKRKGKTDPRSAVVLRYVFLIGFFVFLLTWNLFRNIGI